MRVQIGEYMVQVWRGELPGHFSFLSDLADLELAAWNLHGQKLWSAWAEPPWGYSVQNGVI